MVCDVTHDRLDHRPDVLVSTNAGLGGQTPVADATSGTACWAVSLIRSTGHQAALPYFATPRVDRQQRQRAGLWCLFAVALCRAGPGVMALTVQRNRSRQ